TGATVCPRRQSPVYRTKLRTLRTLKWCGARAIGAKPSSRKVLPEGELRLIATVRMADFTPPTEKNTDARSARSLAKPNWTIGGRVLAGFAKSASFATCAITDGPVGTSVSPLAPDQQEARSRRPR